MFAVDFTEPLHEGEIFSGCDDGSLELLHGALDVEDAVFWRTSEASPAFSEELCDAEAIGICRSYVRRKSIRWEGYGYFFAMRRCQCFFENLYTGGNIDFMAVSAWGKSGDRVVFSGGEDGVDRVLASLCAELFKKLLGSCIVEGEGCFGTDGEARLRREGEVTKCNGPWAMCW